MTPGKLDMAVQVNTTVCRRNVGQIDAIAELLATQGIAMWAVFFLVPVGRGVEEERITPDEHEEVFERLWHHAHQQTVRGEDDRGPALPPFRAPARRQPVGRAAPARPRPRSQVPD